MAQELLSPTSFRGLRGDVTLSSAALLSACSLKHPNIVAFYGANVEVSSP